MAQGKKVATGSLQKMITTKLHTHFQIVMECVCKCVCNDNDIYNTPCKASPCRAMSCWAMSPSCWLRYLILMASQPFIWFASSFVSSVVVPIALRQESAFQMSWISSASFLSVTAIFLWFSKCLFRRHDTLHISLMLMAVVFAALLGHFWEVFSTISSCSSKCRQSAVHCSQ